MTREEGLAKLTELIMECLDLDEGEVTAEVTVAEPLNDKNLDALKDALKSVTGGKDIDLRKFGQELHPKSDVMNADRQSGEFGLLDALDKRPDKPVLGICLGMQMMGVHRGCHLAQHVPDVIEGDLDPVIQPLMQEDQAEQLASLESTNA